MKNLFLLLSVMSILHPLLAQQEPPRYPYKFIAQIEKELQAGNLHVVLAATEFSYIGEYKRTIAIDDLNWQYRQEVFGEKENLSEEEKKAFKKFKPEPAIHYITQRAKNEQIVVVNEAHPKPLHRVFAETLLDSLYQVGFRYLGLEALLMNFSDSTKIAAYDSLLNDRGYPYSRLTGTYTREPQFGNFIRKAIQTGFQVFGYEQTGFQQMPRDSAEALNIQYILQHDPQAKMLIFCGFSHLFEKPQPCPPDDPDCKPWLYMAYYLKNLTGIDPFTINQEILTERVTTPENPYYKLIKAKKPTVFVNKKGKAFNGPEGLDLFDVMVYHPRTKYVQGRPDWLSRNGKFKYYTLKSSDIKIDCPCQIRAYYENEPEAATPADIIEITAKDEQKALVLPPGNYNVVLENESGTLQRLKISVK